MSPHSFPSGHAAASFTGAAFYHFRYNWKIALPVYLIAGYVGWTRVYSRRHYWSDVFAGAAIGTLSSFLFTRQYKKKMNGSVSYFDKEFRFNLIYRFN